MRKRLPIEEVLHLPGVVDAAWVDPPLPALFIGVDRTGMGPSSSTDVTVSASLHLMELIQELDGPS